MTKKKPKNPVGRPPIYKSPFELQKRIDRYFKTEAYVNIGLVKGKKAIQRFAPTITGLVLYCGFCDRKSFYEYESKPEFTHTIKKARTMIEQIYERLLQGANCTGSIFALKNFGWIDEQHINGKGMNATVVIHFGNKPGLLSPAETSVVSRIGSQV